MSMAPFVASLFLACLPLAPVHAPQAASDGPVKVATADQAAFPDTPAGRCAEAWFKMIASGRDEDVRTFESTYRAPRRLEEAGIPERVRRVAKLREEFGTFTITTVATAPSGSLHAVGSASRTGPVELDFDFDKAGKLDAIRIAAERGDSGQAVPLDPQRRAAVVAALAKAVTEEYVFPAKGEAMAAAIGQAAKSGAYDSIGDERALAERLTEDLRAVTNDKHLRVRVAPQPKDANGQATDESHLLPTADEARRHNWAFRSCEIADGNIGVLRFDLFAPDEEAKRVADSAFAFLARCDALVFDLRANGGGSPEMIAYLTSYLFDQPTLLNRMIDRDGDVVGEASTEATVPGQRFAKDLPVYVLTSSRTFSGAEEFSYNLQNLKRATIVGETTGGGAHPVKPVRLDDRFLVVMPHLRAENPITKTNWEGVGVQPDVAVSASEALEKALDLARTKLGR